MKRKEFICGMVIISILVVASMYIGASPIRTEPKVTIKQCFEKNGNTVCDYEEQFTVEQQTDEEGNVEVRVK